MGLGTEVVQDISMLAHWVEIFAMSGQCLLRVITILYNKAHFVKGVKISQYKHHYNSVMEAPISGSFAMKTYLYINDKCICNYQVYYSSVEMNGLVTFSASFLYKLKFGDRLTIRTILRKYVVDFQNLLRSTPFMGFLITETDE